MRTTLALLLLVLTAAGCASTTSGGPSPRPSAANRPVPSSAGPDSTLARQTGIGADQTVNTATGHL